MAAVTGVAVEYASEEVVASCADDGTVAIYEVFPQVDGGNGGDDVSQRASASSGNAVNANVKSAAYTAATTTASSSTIATSPVTTATICPASSITSYKRAVKALALDPDYARRNTRQFVCGGMAGELVLRERGWMSTRDVVVQQGEGAIYAVSWHRTFIAWADEVVWETCVRLCLNEIAMSLYV